MPRYDKLSTDEESNTIDAANRTELDDTPALVESTSSTASSGPTTRHSASTGTFDDGGSYASSSQSTGSSASSFTTSGTSTGWIDNEMHVGRVGVTRYFTMGD